MGLYQILRAPFYMNQNVDLILKLETRKSYIILQGKLTQDLEWLLRLNQDRTVLERKHFTTYCNVVQCLCQDFSQKGTNERGQDKKVVME